MENKQRNGFIFYRSFRESMDVLSDADKLTMYEAITFYALDFFEPNLSGFPLSLFKLIRPQIDANSKRWRNGCMGADFGKLGGAPIGNKNAARTTPKQPQDNPKTTPKEKEKVKEKVKDKDNIKEKEIDKENSLPSVSDETNLRPPAEIEFYKAMENNCPTLLKMKQPITYEQLCLLEKTYPRKKVLGIFTAMENYVDLTKKHKSAYLTAKTWLNRDNNPIKSIQR